MQLAQLRTFTTIAREKNLTRAAEALHLSQSAISSQLKTLEDELGVRLFVRSTRGMALSEAGRQLLGQARDILTAAEAFQQQARALSQTSRQSIAIGLNTDPTFLQVSAINRRLALLRPDLNVIFHASDTIGTAQRLHGGQIDLGFFYGELNDPKIETLLVVPVRICVVVPCSLAPSGRNLDWTGLSTLPWIWVDDNFLFYRVLAQRTQGGLKRPERIVTAANEQIVRELVAAGQGIALMREDEARELVEKGIVTIWDKGWGSLALQAGWMRENREAPQIRAARDAIEYVWRQRTAEQSETLADKVWL